MKKVKEKKRHNKRERAEKIKTSLFILPSALGVAVFFVLPFFIVIYYSLIDNPINAEFVGLDNFIRLINNGSFKLAAKNTALFTALALPLAIIIPLLLATILMNKIPGKSFFRTVLISPLMVPTASIILIFEVIYN